MPDVHSALAAIAAARSSDPLAPATVIAPSHDAALQMRRQLAVHGPFAAVRFEVLSRLAELIAAGYLAAAGRRPLSRPIGDYLAQIVAKESRAPLASVRDLPGYARALRGTFQRLRRGGIRTSRDVATESDPKTAEVLRLFDLFRQATADFYDAEDALDAAAEAVAAGSAGPMADLGAIYVAPPDALSAGADALLAALKSAAPQFQIWTDPPTGPAEVRFILAPDPTSEAREVVREVLAALESGAALHEIAVFHGADPSYPKLLRDAFAAAGLPTVPLPGVPLVETPAGRAVLALARLPEADYSRTALMDLLGLPGLQEYLPGGDGRVRNLATAWDRLSRQAGITCGAVHWQRGLQVFSEDRRRDAQEHERLGDDDRARRALFAADQADTLQDVVRSLIARLDPLRADQPARRFIDTFKGIVQDYISSDPSDQALDRVYREIEQLGTIDAVGGTFTLATFAESLRSNLERACLRPGRLGEGVVIADYRRAAGMRFSFVVLCGAYEGAVPAGPGSDALLEDRVWRELRASFPFIEDAALRLQRSRQAVDRVRAAAAGGTMVWAAPLYEPGGGRDFFPSPFMVRAAAALAPGVDTAGTLRRHPPASWLRRLPSPLAGMLRGPIVDPGELGLRGAVTRRQNREPPADPHLQRALAMLRARRSDRFTEWDGNLADLQLVVSSASPRRVSPTSLEKYALCGFRYLCSSILRLKAVEEPEERDIMDPAERGSLVHRVLYRFFVEQAKRGRPAPGETWTSADTARMGQILSEELAHAGARGLTGLAVFAQHEARTLAADLERFLHDDDAFRSRTGAVPAQLEVRVPDLPIAGVVLTGVVDRIDRSPQGGPTWVIDYKTGSRDDFEGMKNDPLAGGAKLQLPAYLAAVQAADGDRAIYWFVTRRGGYKQLAFDWTPENRQRFQDTVAAIVAGIQAGSFPAVPGEENDHYRTFKNCRYCDFDRICSRRRDDEFAAKESDPALRPWRAVAATARGEELP